MPRQPTNPIFSNTSPLCPYRSANARPCRLSAANLASPFCPSHASLPENQQEPSGTAASLTADLKEFRSAIPINDFLARLLLLLAESKISPRQAPFLAYITHHLLRHFPPTHPHSHPNP